MNYGIRCDEAMARKKHLKPCSKATCEACICGLFWNRGEGCWEHFVNPETSNQDARLVRRNNKKAKRWGLFGIRTPVE